MNTTISLDPHAIGELQQIRDLFGRRLVSRTQVPMCVPDDILIEVERCGILRHLLVRRGRQRPAIAAPATAAPAALISTARRVNFISEDAMSSFPPGRTGLTGGLLSLSQ